MTSVLVHFFEHRRWGPLVEAGVEGQSLTAEDQLFILTQAGVYLVAARGHSAPEVRICYERAESLCHSLNRPLLLHVALAGQWRYSLMTDKLTATMQIAKRVYSLARKRNDSAQLLGAYRALAATLYFLGAFQTAREYAMRGVQIWRSGEIGSLVEEPVAPAVACLSYAALCEWHLGEIASCQATMAEAVSAAKELNDTHALAAALFFAAILGACERNPAEVERLASEVIELSTRKNFANWLPGGEVLYGWAQSASGNTAEGLSWIRNGIEAWQATGAMLLMPYWLALKAEALHLANHTSEALEVWQLFSAGRACGTLLLWASYFATFMILATSGAWTPNLLQRAGIEGARSSVAVALFALGSVFGTPLAGFLVSRFAARRVLPAALVGGAVTFAAVGHAGQSIALVIGCLGLAGFFLGVASSGLIALGPLLYSTAFRSTGVGWAMGLGRHGAIVGPLAIGLLVSRGWQIGDTFAALGIPALCAALFTSLISINRPRGAAAGDEL